MGKIYDSEVGKVIDIAQKSGRKGIPNLVLAVQSKKD